MSELYAVWDSVDGDFRTGTKEEMKKAYERAKEEIMDYINDGGSDSDSEVLLLKVVRQATIIRDADNQDDPQKYGYDHWVKWDDEDLS